MKHSILKKMALPLITVAVFANNAFAGDAAVDSIPVTRYLTDFKYDLSTGYLSFHDSFRPTASSILTRNYYFHFFARSEKTSFVKRTAVAQEYYDYGAFDESGFYSSQIYSCYLNKDYAYNYYYTAVPGITLYSVCDIPSAKTYEVEFEQFAYHVNAAGDYSMLIRNQIEELRKEGFARIRIAPIEVSYNTDIQNHNNYYGTATNLTAGLINYYDLDITTASVQGVRTSYWHDGIHNKTHFYSGSDDDGVISFNKGSDSIVVEMSFRNTDRMYYEFSYVAQIDNAAGTKWITVESGRDIVNGYQTQEVTAKIGKEFTNEYLKDRQESMRIRFGVSWGMDTVYSEPMTISLTEYPTDVDDIHLITTYSVGGDVLISSENECISVTKNTLMEYGEDGSILDFYMYTGGSWMTSGEIEVDLKPNVMYGLAYKLGINESESCSYLKELQGTSANPKVYVNDVYAESGLTTTMSLLYKFTPTSYDFGAVTIAADRSSATIDGTSDVAVADMDGIEVSGDVTLNRSYVAGKYSTVMLPFATSASNVPGVSFYGLHDVVKKDGEWQVQVSPVSEIQANTPYIVVASDDASNLVVTGGVTFNTTTGTRTSTAGNWQFVGTYEFRNWDEDHNAEEIGTTYGFASAEGDNDGVSIGTFGKVKAGAYIYPLRAYLRYVPVVTPKPASALAKSRAVASIDNLPESMDVVIVGGDSDEETTVIGTINTRTGEFRNAGDRWFDLKGRFLGVKRPTAKGTYYNNGKKVIVR